MDPLGVDEAIRAIRLLLIRHLRVLFLRAVRYNRLFFESPHSCQFSTDLRLHSREDEQISDSRVERVEKVFVFPWNEDKARSRPRLKELEKR